MVKVWRKRDGKWLSQVDELLGRRPVAAVRTQKVNDDSPCIFQKPTLKASASFEDFGQSILIVCCLPCLKRKLGLQIRGWQPRPGLGLVEFTWAFLTTSCTKPLKKKSEFGSHHGRDATDMNLKAFDITSDGGEQPTLSCNCSHGVWRLLAFLMNAFRDIVASIDRPLMWCCGQSCSRGDGAPKTLLNKERSTFLPEERVLALGSSEMVYSRS